MDEKHLLSYLKYIISKTTLRLIKSPFDLKQWHFPEDIAAKRNIAAGVTVTYAKIDLPDLLREELRVCVKIWGRVGYRDIVIQIWWVDSIVNERFHQKLLQVVTNPNLN